MSNASSIPHQLGVTPIDLQNFRERMQSLRLAERIGYVTEVIVNTVKASLPDAMQGELCEIHLEEKRSILAEVIAFDQNTATLSCMQNIAGVMMGARVTPLGKAHCVKAKRSAASVVLDGLGRCLDNPRDWQRGVISTSDDAVPVMRSAISATERPPIDKPLYTGVRIIDQVLTIGEGQRIGIFAPPGCGKSTLMAQIVRGTQVDAVVFGLVGERGRELNEFMQREITPALRDKSYFVCATSDRSPIERVRCAFTATTLAESLRDQGKSVLLLIDSITRLARAQREVGLMAGEPTTQSGFTPSVYTILPELIERSGRTSKGSITAIFTVLMDGEKVEDDPVASEAKSLLDGHIILSTKLVERSHFPAIDPMRSLSRVMSHVAHKRAFELSGLMRRAYGLYADVELLLRINEYKMGNDPLIDEAVRIKTKLDSWCQQGRFDITPPDEAIASLEGLLANFENLCSR